MATAELTYNRVTRLWQVGDTENFERQTTGLLLAVSRSRTAQSRDNIPVTFFSYHGFLCVRTRDTLNLFLEWGNPLQSGPTSIRKLYIAGENQKVERIMKAGNIPLKNKNSTNHGIKIKTTLVRYSVQPEPPQKSSRQKP